MSEKEIKKQLKYLENWLVEHQRYKIIGSLDSKFSFDLDDLQNFYDYITNLQVQLQQKENIIKELNDKIEDDKMIIEGNWGCIDNLRKDYNLQKSIIKEVREYITYWHYRNDFRINSFTTGVKEELLEILDKENDNNEQ